MKVAFDEQIFALQAYGGISRMFAELAKQFYADPGLDVELLPLNAPVINRYILDDELVRTRMAVRDAGHEYRSLLRYITRIQPRPGNDIVHNTFYLPHGLAAYPGAKRVVTVHDMIPELMPKTRRRLDFLTLKKRYVSNADHVICVSEATRSDLLEVYGPIEAPISVVHHGVDPMFRPDRDPHPELPARYILFVGNRSQYKDADVLMRAFAQAARHERDIVLLFVGGGPFSSEERRLLDRLGIAARTIQVSLADRLMPAAYSNALLCVFPSRFEGFGLPALEAMACGTPTVLARGTSLPEVGGTAAAYFEPGNAEELAVTMEKLLGDEKLRDDHRQAGIERAALFTWQKSALETAGVYRATLQS
ncbi:MAG: glycosyltransferase [Actinomycetales bacterium]|nr:glycosyltransferase [Actinomycetales bacterium]